ncbi:MAG: hypothetical protein K0Q76_3423 [Panacagrimonas sp.]|jgi:hypothetical protein|nr:hypothetical protein [Panacagrimonas sp.]MCC2658315.1 hypothetical protein [Panacagrimonas sp.]
MTRRLIAASAVVLVASMSGVLAAALVPVPSVTRDQIHEIPAGTWARRMAGEPATPFPERIRLVLGVNDVLVLRNQDDVPHQFGPALMMPGQSFRLPFTTASEFQFACTAHASGQMVIVVDPHPDTPWARLRWRAQRALELRG